MANGVATPVGYGSELYDELEALGFATSGVLLDIGAGLGAGSEPLAQRGARVTALDLDAAALTAYRARVPAVTAVTGDALALPFEAGSFDGTLLARVLHVIDPAPAIAEAVRVTKPGGRVAMWWRELGTDEPARLARDRVSAELGLAPIPDETPAGFRAFYGAPFRAHELRVIPFLARITPARWIADERAGGMAVRALGEAGAERFYDAYAQALSGDLGGDGAFRVRFTQFVYLGVTA